MNLENYLFFNGAGREALEFYGKVFDTDTSRVMTYGSIEGAASDLDPQYRDYILHCALKIGDSTLMISDSLDEVVFGNNFAITINVQDEEEFIKLVNRLKVQGEIIDNPGETFFAHNYCSLVDRFSINWIIVQGKDIIEK